MPLLRQLRAEWLPKYVVIAVLAVPLWPRVAQAQDYVQVCSVYGARFMYLPGTNICFDWSTGDMREQTPGGTWRRFLYEPTTPFQWVASPAAGCYGGTVVDLGTVRGADFTPNQWGKYAAPLLPMTLAQGEYVASLMLSGGFTQSGAAFGLVRFTGTPSTQFPAGTELVRADGFTYLLESDVTLDATGAGIGFAQANTAGAAGVAAVGTVLTLSPAVASVDATATIDFGFDAASVESIGRFNTCFAYPDPIFGYTDVGCADAGGALSQSPATIALTPRLSTPPYYEKDPQLLVYLPTYAAAVTLGGAVSFSACVRNATAPGGCSVSDNSNGTATMTCPDGSSVDLVTPKGLSKATSGGCNSTPDASLLAVAALAILLVRRRKSVRFSAALLALVLVTAACGADVASNPGVDMVC